MATQSVARRSFNDFLRDYFASTGRMIITYLVALTIAELATTYVHPVAGSGLHALLLVVLVIHAAFVSESAEFPILIALLMAPLIRLLSLALPLFVVDQKYWYLIVSLPLFAACFIAMRLLRYNLYKVGFNFNHLTFQLITAFLGLVFGYIEFVILRPEPLMRNPTLPELLIATFTLFIGTGLMEELVFRGVMQQSAEKIFGGWGSIFFSAAVFMIMHIGWQSAVDLVFVFVAGFWWGYVFYRTRSILGITLAHTLTNIMLFIVLPLAFPNDLRPAPTLESNAPTVSEVVISPVTPAQDAASEAPEIALESAPPPAPQSITPSVTTVTIPSESNSLDLQNVLILLVFEIYLLLISILTLVAIVRRRRKSLAAPPGSAARQSPAPGDTA
jgi:hypothetical protein